MFVVQYKKEQNNSSMCCRDTLEEAQEAAQDREWLRIYEVDKSTGQILQNIYPEKIMTKIEVVRDLIQKLRQDAEVQRADSTIVVCDMHSNDKLLDDAADNLEKLLEVMETCKKSIGAPIAHNLAQTTFRAIQEFYKKDES